MQITAHHRYLRMSPKKVRLVADAVVGLSVQACEDHLKFMNKRAAGPIAKLLTSAVSNAKQTQQLTKEHLYVQSVIANEGPMLKRSRARAFGRSAPLRKRSTHLTLTLGVREGRGVPTREGETKAAITAPKLVTDVKEALKWMRGDSRDSSAHEHSKSGDSDKKVTVKELVSQGTAEEAHEKTPLHDKQKTPRRGFIKKFFTRKTG